MNLLEKSSGRMKGSSINSAKARHTEALEAKVKHLSGQLKEMQAKQAHAERAMHPIERPMETAGKDWSIKTAMELDENDRLYKSIQCTIWSLIHGSHIQEKVPFPRQDKTQLSKIYILARKCQPYLEQFPRDWAAEECVKLYLWNKRYYNKARGYYDEEDLGVGASPVPDSGSDGI
ncbi:hypothetical protein AcV5_003041 [Taiwanofungus camphoratus]|nr:hypothetical protein AcV5_003041 [Antrodia cinnamomea]